MKRPQIPFWQPRLPWQSRLAVAGLALLGCLLLGLTIATTPAPIIKADYGETTVDIQAERAWTLFPGDCVTVDWSLEGIQSLYVNGAGKIGADSLRYCPALFADGLQFDITAKNGITLELRLEIHHLPELALYLLGFVSCLGSGVVAWHYLRQERLEAKPKITWLLLAGLLLAGAGVWLRLLPQDAPLVEADEGGLSVRFWAERDSIIFPHECLPVGWSVVGAQSLHYMGEAAPLESNPGRGQFCAGDGETARLQVSSENGATFDYELGIWSLFPEPLNPPAAFRWSLVLLALAIISFGALALRGLRQGWRATSSGDKLALCACLLFPAAFYLPFGFDSPPHWENWILHSYFEGGPPGFFDSWVVSRFTGLVHRVLAYLISSESFHGYHIVNCLMHSGTAALVYGSLRLLKVAPLYAFLMALLFTVYPVNPMQLSTRALHHNFNKLFLLAAVYLLLAFRQAPSRLGLCGLWLALAFHVNSFESGLPLVLITPALLYAVDRKLSWRNFNLSVIWYLAPAFKLGYTLLIWTTGREFYQSGLLDGDVLGDAAGTASQVLGWVYPFAFVDSWGEAFATLGRNEFWLPTLVVLAGCAGVALYLWREEAGAREPTARQLTLLIGAGTLLILPAIVVLMWYPLYNQDPWRMLLFAPIGAVIALFSALLLLTKPIRRRRARDLVVLGACLLLLLAAVSRLFLQMEGFVASAEQKARILRDVVELAPALESDTQIALITDMEIPALHEAGIFELLTRDMFWSALRVLYTGDAPQFAYFCQSIDECSFSAGEATLFDAADPASLLARSLVFKLNHDLSVELLPDPVAFLELDNLDVNDYDPSRLYDADAPIPPRVDSALGLEPGA